MAIETQRCGNCEFYKPECMWCGKRGAGFINVKTQHGTPTKEYPCNSHSLSHSDGEECKEHSCRINGRWIVVNTESK